MNGIFRLYNQNIIATHTAMNVSLVIQLCHPVDLKTSKNRELKHPSYPNTGDTVEDVLTLKDVCGYWSDSSLLRLVSELFTNTFMTPHQLSLHSPGGTIQ